MGSTFEFILPTILLLLQCGKFLLSVASIIVLYIPPWDKFPELHISLKWRYMEGIQYTHKERQNKWYSLRTSLKRSTGHRHPMVYIYFGGIICYLCYIFPYVIFADLEYLPFPPFLQSSAVWLGNREGKPPGWFECLPSNANAEYVC